MSLNNGKNVEVLSNDHKPGQKEEERRITQAGGRVYQ
jgi:serine/threonine protein phosphatase PrpC